MGRLLIISAAVSIAAFNCGCESPNQRRAIPYKSQVPIGDRLLPTDKQVYVSREPSEYYAPLASSTTYEEEIERLRRGDIIALVRVVGVRSELVDHGAWVETKVTAEVDQLIQSNLDSPPSSSIEFTFLGGETRIGAVSVTAGRFPRFQEGEQYLVFLVKHPRILLGNALHVNAGGVLEPLKSNTGAQRSSRTELDGKNVSQVLEALRGK